MRSLYTAVFVVGLTWTQWLCALPERVFSVDFGFGVPQLFAVTATVKPWTRWQLGLSWSVIPPSGLLNQAFSFPSQTVDLDDGNEYELSPVVTPSLIAYSPFVRYFPHENNFYLQAAVTVFRLTASLSSGLRDTFTNVELDGGTITGNITLLQAFPSFSIGYLFSGKIYFFNVAIGAAFISRLVTTSQFTTNLPDSVGGLEGNSTELDELENEINQGSTEPVDDLRRRFPGFPFLHLAFGLYF